MVPSKCRPGRGSRAAPGPVGSSVRAAAARGGRSGGARRFLLSVWGQLRLSRPAVCRPGRALAQLCAYV